MTSSDSVTSNEGKTKEKDFEDYLKSLFDELNQDYDGLSITLETILNENKEAT